MNERVSVQADSKLREEEKRALRYLETRRDCNSVQAVSVTTGSLYSVTLPQTSTYYFNIPAADQTV